MDLEFSRWDLEMNEFLPEQGNTPVGFFFGYTTFPKCANP